MLSQFNNMQLGEYLIVGIRSSRDSGLHASASTRISWWNARRTLNSTPSTSISSSCGDKPVFRNNTQSDAVDTTTFMKLHHQPGIDRWPQPRTGFHHRPGERPGCQSWKDWTQPRERSHHMAPCSWDCGSSLAACCISLNLPSELPLQLKGEKKRKSRFFNTDIETLLIL